MKEEIEKHRDESLIKNGFNPNDFTEQQKELIFEADEAPENFVCDGEITTAEAITILIKNLHATKMRPDLIHKVIKKYFSSSK